MKWDELRLAIQGLIEFIVSDWRFWIIAAVVAFLFWAWTRKGGKGGN